MKNSFDIQTNRPVFTLGIAAELSNIPTHTIRQYIDKGLIIPYKLDSSRHLFSQRDIDRLKSINNLIREKGLNFAGIKAMMAMIPCWAIRNCSDDERQSCSAYTSDFYPCWEASEKGRICRNENCRECEVYDSMNEDIKIKSLVRSLI